MQIKEMKDKSEIIKEILVPAISHEFEENLLFCVHMFSHGIEGSMCMRDYSWNFLIME